MSRFHIHIAVTDLQPSIDFYSAVLGCAPTKVQSDYAKWQLDDPRVNFAISSRGAAPGINHLGLQSDSAEELAGMAARLIGAGFQGVGEKQTACCYARSDKYWTVDPQGIPWETFHTLDSVPTFDGSEPTASRQSACCVPPVSQTNEAPTS